MEFTYRRYRSVGQRQFLRSVWHRRTYGVYSQGSSYGVYGYGPTTGVYAVSNTGDGVYTKAGTGGSPDVVKLEVGTTDRR